MTRASDNKAKSNETEKNKQIIEPSILTDKILNKNKNIKSSSQENDPNDSEVSDEEIELLVNSSLRLLRKPSKELMSAESFANLNNEIINRGIPSSSYSSSNLMKESSSNLIKKQLDSGIYDDSTLLAPPLKRIKQKAPVTAGKGWFDIEPLKMNESLQRDIKLIEMRNYIDPKRFYKKAEKLGQILHVGTVIEAAHEYKSARHKNAERKLTIVDEMLADKQISGYSKKAFMEIQTEKMNKQKHHQRKGKKFVSLYNKQKKKINKLF